MNTKKDKPTAWHSAGALLCAAVVCVLAACGGTNNLTLQNPPPPPSTPVSIAFQPAPYQAVYGASKAFVLSFSQALWAEARAAGVAVTALCPGPTRTGFVEALGAADAGHTAIYKRLADPEPVIEAGLRALDKGRAVVIPGVRNKLIAMSGRFMPREWLTRVSARLLRPFDRVSRTWSTTGGIGSM